MRHFSGEFQGIRLLMLDELDSISGGDGEDTDDNQTPPPDGPDIVVTGRRIQVTPIAGFPASTGSLSLPDDPDPQPGHFHPTGGCGTMQNELTEALDNLSNGSAAAKAIIDAAREMNTQIKLIREDTTSDRDGTSQDGVVSWDPFSAVTGLNYNNTRYYEAPTISLMHEIAHRVFPNLTEAEVMNLTNAVAKDLNTNLGTHYDTNRDRHFGDERYNTNDTDSDQRGQRPACS